MGHRRVRLTLPAITEAAQKVSPRALEAALVETNAGFDLSSRQLLDLEASGVPTSVIDLMVALSYPDRFVVERRRADRAVTPFSDDPFLLGWAFGYPYWSDLYGLYSPLYGRYSHYYYTPFSYGYLRGYEPYYFPRGFAIVDGGDPGDVSAARPSGQARAIDGLGYTRVRPREPQPAEPRTSAGAVRSAGGSASPGASSVSSQGYSSGGSGGSTGDGGGRVAVPR